MHFVGGKVKARILYSIVASVDPDTEGYNLAGWRTQPRYTPKAKLRGIQQASQTFGDPDVAFIFLNEQTQLDRALLWQPDLLQRNRQWRAFCGIGAADDFHQRSQGGIPLTTLS
ncbi:hypothetical protein I8E17_29565 (plasmid) [Rhizobium sp. AB2/73]|nr:hypothetical protein J5284_28235 [Rhizobium sp. AB2/73]UEQ84432.1 hypothetical protein I8E17_29565 [Rhizobium sp. AB2/73]